MKKIMQRKSFGNFVVTEGNKHFWGFVYKYQPGIRQDLVNFSE